MKKRKVVLEREQRNRQRSNKRKNEARELLCRMKLDSLLNPLSKTQQDKILATRSKPKLKLEFHSSVTDQEVVKQVTDWFDRYVNDKSAHQITATTNLGECKVDISLQEVIVLLESICDALFDMQYDDLTVTQEVAVKNFFEIMSGSLNSIREKVWRNIIEYMQRLFVVISSVDNSLYWMCADRRVSKSGGMYSVPVVYGGKNTPVRIRDNTSWKDAYPVSHGYFQTGIRTLKISSKPLDKEGEERDLQVFVSKHALLRLRERLPVLSHVLHYGLTLSVIKSVVVEYKGQWLLEYQINGNKLGYFPLQFINDQQVVLSTFLFITMSQTPEGEKLYDLLKMTRQDMEWNKLYDIDTFVHTDIFDDKVLDRALVASGCGGLKNVRTMSLSRDAIPQSFSEDLKKYMRWDERREQKVMAKVDEMMRDAEENDGYS